MDAKKMAKIVADRMKKATKTKSYDELGKILGGITSQSISGAIGKGKIPDRWFDIIEQDYGVTREELYRPPAGVRSSCVQIYGIEDGGRTWVNVPLSLEEACREAPLRRLLEMTVVVLQSGTTHAVALTSNIEAFYEAVRDKQDKDAKAAELEALKHRVAKLEDKLDNAGNDG